MGMLGDDIPVRIDCWDGSTIAPTSDRVAGTLRLMGPDAVRRLLWSPNELGFARAFVAGELELDGDIFEVVGALRAALESARPPKVRSAVEVVAAARRLQLVGRPLPPPPEEARLHGGRHSERRDAEAISHHYDVGNEFYALVLGPSMTYSCARFVSADTDLTAAQAAKHELVCRKLGLPDRPGARLLDVGCGWGSMAIHAATHHDVSVVGITISEPQADEARKRVAAAGVADRVEIRLQDYRRLGGEQFDAISSIGMAEHVGREKIDRYFEILHEALTPRGRLLNHAISSVGGSRISPRSFIGRYVFPDGHLLDVGDSVQAMERAGFEVRDVESLREHYTRTLRSWVHNLEEHWDEAVVLVGPRRARVWRLYMAGSAVSFAAGSINVHQVHGVVPTADGDSGMPPTRAGFE
jgi:cyclopropane-fatty-acyl-phospholipid synthase